MPLGKPRDDIERLKRHFGKEWKKHDISELPPRGTGEGWKEQLMIKVSNRPVKSIKEIKTPKRRRELPPEYFLLPKERKFPIVDPKTGKLDCKLVLAAIKRAAEWGYPKVEAKAKMLYQKYCKKI